MAYLLRKILHDKQGKISFVKVVAAGILGIFFTATALWLGLKTAESIGLTGVLQTADTGTGDTPNAGGFNAGTKTDTYVSGTGRVYFDWVRVRPYVEVEPKAEV